MADVSMSFESWFTRVAGSGAVPHAWQRSLAESDSPRTRLIRIPTGMGKTLGVLAAWSWHRVHRQDPRWPRRLVWCLPMRVLVEQTQQVAREVLQSAGVLWDAVGSHEGKAGVHLLMGGASPDGDWHLYPEENAILVGTQDMLLSRALNRGYAAGRARWPLEFGLLSHDALWIMDEVQLMDVGLATSAQLQAYHDEDTLKGFRPRHTWWMSATLQADWLRSVDTEPRHGAWTAEVVSVPAAQRESALGRDRKAFRIEDAAARSPKQIAELILDEHEKQAASGHGRITLMVCNTVERATEAYDALRARAPEVVVELVHSRFRPEERSQWRERFLNRAACHANAERIIVATQVVEAGVDVSAGTVITDLAPWPSLVQRFGRCARYGGAGSIVILDRGREDKAVLPYRSSDLEAAAGALNALSERGGDAGLSGLEEFEESLDQTTRSALYRYTPDFLLLRRELDELFDTTPDLTGADLDISRFIRSGEDRDLLVFWDHVPLPGKDDRRPAPSVRRQPFRSELCPVPFLKARDWLCGPGRNARLRSNVRAWTWDWLDGRWVVATRDLLTPGRVVCVAAEVGGYLEDRGFAPESDEEVQPVRAPRLDPLAQAADRADASEDAEDLSAAEWKTIACHGGEVAAEAMKIARAIGLAPDAARVLELGGRWHDLGKAHPAFQGAIRLPGARPDRQDLAKAPGDAWQRPYRTADNRDIRAGLRHELASALALFDVLARNAPDHPALLGPWADALRLSARARATMEPTSRPTRCEEEVLALSAGDFDLLAYVVLCHHGKVRVALHAGPKDQDYRGNGDGRGLPIRGIREGDVLPGVLLDPTADPLPPMTLTLEPAGLGLSPRTGASWRERTQGLLDRFGPGALAWLEALIIAADRRASRLRTVDPALAPAEGKS